MASCRCCRKSQRVSSALEEIVAKARLAEAMAKRCCKNCGKKAPRPSSRLLPWETHLLREQGRQEKSPAAFQQALRQALSLATDPSQARTLEKIYSESRHVKKKTKKKTKDKGDLETMVCQYERDYRRVLAEAAAEEGPTAATSRRLVRAIRRLDRASESKSLQTRPYT